MKSCLKKTMQHFCNRQNAAWTKVRRIRAKVHQPNKQIKRVDLRIE